MTSSSKSMKHLTTTKPSHWRSIKYRGYQ